MPRLVELSCCRAHGYVFAVLPLHRLILSLGVINMKNVKSVTKATSVLCGLAFSLLVLTGCEPKVGTKGWCEKMDQKPKGDWSANEAADYGKHCIFDMSGDKAEP